MARLSLPQHRTASSQLRLGFKKAFAYPKYENLYTNRPIESARTWVAPHVMWIHCFSLRLKSDQCSQAQPDQLLIEMLYRLVKITCTGGNLRVFLNDNNFRLYWHDAPALWPLLREAYKPPIDYCKSSKTYRALLVVCGLLVLPKTTSWSKHSTFLLQPLPFTVVHSSTKLNPDIFRDKSTNNTFRCLQTYTVCG